MYCYKCGICMIEPKNNTDEICYLFHCEPCGPKCDICQTNHTTSYIECKKCKHSALYCEVNKIIICNDENCENFNIFVQV